MTARPIQSYLGHFADIARVNSNSNRFWAPEDLLRDSERVGSEYIRGAHGVKAMSLCIEEKQIQSTNYFDVRRARWRLDLFQRRTLRNVREVPLKSDWLDFKRMHVLNASETFRETKASSSAGVTRLETANFVAIDGFNVKEEHQRDWLCRVPLRKWRLKCAQEKP